MVVELVYIGGCCDCYVSPACPGNLQARCVGLFGCLDLVRADGKLLQRLEGPPAPEAALLRKAMMAEGLIGFFRPPHLHCAPRAGLQSRQTMIHLFYYTS